MLVICQQCGKLVDENQAIKMNMVEFKRFQQVKLDAGPISFFQDEYNRYTQICKKCYDKVEW